MKKLLTAIAAGLKLLGEAALTPLRIVRAPGPDGRAARMLAGLAVLVVVLVASWWANQRFGLASLLRPPAPALGSVWLPLLVLLAVASAWTGWRLLELVTEPPGSSEFPDVERAWLGALDELARAEVDPRELPLFLVLGRLAGSSEGLMGASRMNFRLRPGADDPTAPIQVYATYDAIFVLDEGASLIGRSASLLAGEGRVADGVSPPVPGPTATPTVPTPPTSAGPGAAARPEASVAVAERDAGPSTTPPRRPQPSPILQDRREVERMIRRLRLLCRLIARDRRPFCPVNGIILALPFRAIQADDLAIDFCSACRRELEAAREALGVDCPVLAVFGDLEQAEGFRELVARLPEADRARPVGLDLPLSPDIPPGRWPDLIRHSTRWFAHSGFPSLTLGPFGQEHGASPGRSNEPIFRLLHAVHQGHENLARILIRGLAGEEPTWPPLLAGVYLAGTGALEADRAFGEAVFRRALQVQNAVSWTRSTVKNDRLLGRRAAWGFAAIALWSAALVAAMAFRFLRPGH